VPVIFKRKKKGADLGALVSELEQAVGARDGARTERAFVAVMGALEQAAENELVEAGPRLAALLPAFPPVGPRPYLGNAAGFCVERGAEPLACAEPILDAVRRDLDDALEFARRWTATGGDRDELPPPDEEIIDETLLARLVGDGTGAQDETDGDGGDGGDGDGDDEYEALRLALAWCAAENWQPPALAVLLRDPEVRRRYAATLLPLCRELADLERHDLKCLYYALSVLDDEPLIVLHRPTGKGSRCASAASGTTSSCTRCSRTCSSAVATCPVPHPRPRASAWPPTRRPPRGSPTPSRPGPSSSSPRTASGSGTKACPPTSPWWTEAVSSSSTRRRTRVAGTPTGSSPPSRAGPS
jgi:hypothetical protein